MIEGWRALWHAVLQPLMNDDTSYKLIDKTAGNKHVKRIQENYQGYLELAGKVAS